MPPGSTVDSWRVRNVEFAAALAAAISAGGGPAKAGRPSSYTPQMAERLCQRIGAGEALHVICEEPDMPGQTTVYQWREAHPEFDALMGHAREAQADRLFHEALQIARGATAETVAAAKLLVATIRWQAAKLAPKVYGERVEHKGDMHLTVEVQRFGQGAD